MPSRSAQLKENLVPRIQNLIDGYSKDSILKEYLQNSDDSGATELIVTFDQRIHHSIDNTIYERAKGPALLLHNDSKFEEKDFDSIILMSAQGKVNDPKSTGRFGQGFYSSFSISDHPSFISNGRAYWFDVLNNAVSYNQNENIQIWDEDYFSEIQEWLDTFSKSSKNSGYLSGTTFRLPLRNDTTAIESDISSEIFTISDFLKWCDEWRD